MPRNRNGVGSPREKPGKRQVESLARQCPARTATIEDLDDDLEMWEENPANKKELEKAVRELRSYIEANQSFIPNCGDR
jgi:hypothetical protein